MIYQPSTNTVHESYARVLKRRPIYHSPETCRVDDKEKSQHNNTQSHQKSSPPSKFNRREGQFKWRKKSTLDAFPEVECPTILSPSGSSFGGLQTSVGSDYGNCQRSQIVESDDEERQEAVGNGVVSESDVPQRVICGVCGSLKHVTKNHGLKLKRKFKGSRFGVGKKNGTRRNKYQKLIGKSRGAYIKTYHDKEEILDVSGMAQCYFCPFIAQNEKVLKFHIETKHQDNKYIKPEVVLDENYEKEGCPYELINRQLNGIEDFEIKYPITVHFKHDFTEWMNEYNSGIKMNLNRVGKISKMIAWDAFIQCSNCYKQNNESLLQGFVKIKFTKVGEMIEHDLFDLRTDTKKRTELRHPNALLAKYVTHMTPVVTYANQVLNPDCYEYTLNGDCEAIDGVWKALEQDNKSQLTVSYELLAQISTINIMDISSNFKTIWERVKYAIGYNTSVNISRYTFGLIEMETALLGFYWVLAQKQKYNLPFPMAPKTLESDMDIVTQKLISPFLESLRKGLSSFLKIPI